MPRGEVHPTWDIDENMTLLDHGVGPIILGMNMHGPVVSGLRARIERQEAAIERLADALEKMDEQLCEYKASMDYYKGLYEATMQFNKDTINLI